MYLENLSKERNTFVRIKKTEDNLDRQIDRQTDKYLDSLKSIYISIYIRSDGKINRKIRK